MQHEFDYQLLADCPEHIPALSQLYFEELGHPWVPGADLARAQASFQEHLHRDTLPLTLVALHGNIPIGMASLRDNDGIRDDLSPWLGSLVVDPDYRRRGVARSLITNILQLAHGMGYAHVYLFALDPTLPAWYNLLGWREIAKDEFRQRPVTVMMRTTVTNI